MPAKTSKNIADYVVPLNINGLEGRMLRLAAPKTKRREMLLLYGSHSSIERMFSLAQELGRYGGVTMPDLPGFGGMDSMFKIGHKADIDSMADYLAAFVKLRYRRRRFTIIGVSYGFALATRMLERYPDIAKRVDIVVSIAGFVHKDDFHVPRWQFYAMKYGGKLLKRRWPSRFARLVINDPIITAVYTARGRSHNKMRDAEPEERKRRIAFEVILWKTNDLRTYFYTGYSMFVLDLCRDRVANVRAYHIAVGEDQFFDNYLVEQHLKVIYSRVEIIRVKLKSHMPTIIATPKEVAPFVPPKLRRILAKAPEML